MPDATIVHLSLILVSYMRWYRIGPKFENLFERNPVKGSSCGLGADVRVIVG